MTEVPRPEATQRHPNPVRIFSGARLKPDGTFVSPAHQALSDLWTYEMSRRDLPGFLKRIPKKTDSETRISLRIVPNSQEAALQLEKVRNRLEEGVKDWILTGAKPYADIAVFREEYITPLEEEQ